MDPIQRFSTHDPCSRQSRSSTTFPTKNHLVLLALHPPLLSGPPQFLLWKKQGTAVPPPSPFHQTSLRHPGPGRRAQVFPRYCISKSSILGLRWGISPLYGTFTALTSPSPQPPPWAPAIPQFPTLEVPQPMQGGQGGVEGCSWVGWRGSILPAAGCYTAAPGSSLRKPPGFQKGPSQRSAVRRGWLGQSPQCRGKRAPPRSQLCPPSHP